MTDVVVQPPLCAQPPRVPPALPEGLAPARQRAIVLGSARWVNGTVLHYCFFSDGPYAVPETQREAIRGAFAEWKGIGIGLSYKELDDLGESEVRIGYSEADGSWSGVGREILTIP